MGVSGTAWFYGAQPTVTLISMTWCTPAGVEGGAWGVWRAMGSSRIGTGGNETQPCFHGTQPPPAGRHMSYGKWPRSNPSNHLVPVFLSP